MCQTAAPLKDGQLCGNQRAKETAEGATGISEFVLKIILVQSNLLRNNL